ncbi:MAG: 2OG-Fe(II) oxygenase [Acidobacteria bacterium]|nr:2OG-Fe(II) oxygenase [Acidobacteriota bacterium]MBV9479083.1 2OG-Fe(II) oxygenase [Acidobacteriota bacterium]
MRALTLRRDGVAIVETYLDDAACTALLDEIHAYAARHELPLIVREDGERALRYKVIDGDAIHEDLPSLVALYERVGALVRASDATLIPLPNRTASVNVNLTPPGGEYRWHYDRNAVTAILFLNSVGGGETEMYANHRLRLGRAKDTLAQRALDRIWRFFTRFTAPLVVAPAPGRMIVMRGDRCLHSVRRVTGIEERINVIMTFDTPGARFRAEENLDPYLYSKTATPDFDPNYRG